MHGYLGSAAGCQGVGGSRHPALRVLPQFAALPARSRRLTCSSALPRMLRVPGAGRHARLAVTAAFNSGSSGAWGRSYQPPGGRPQQEEGGVWSSAKFAVGDALRAIQDLQRDSTVVRTALYLAQFCSSVAFVVLYVWSTYSHPAPWTWRYNLDLALCITFALEYLWRLRGGEGRSALLSPWHLCDLLAFLPPLIDLGSAMLGLSAAFSLGRYDLRWFKLLRGVRVMRIGLLAGEYKAMRLTSSGGALLTSAASVRIVQLAASVVMLLFTASTLVHIVERMPWHEALWFVATTLSTVGFGDVVVHSLLGRAIVLALILVGVVLIPVQASQLYSQLAARRVMLGPIPDSHEPLVVVSTRLNEVRGFSDFYSEFYHALQESRLPKKLRMVVLCNKPSFEFRALQELHERRLTLLEGSGLSEQDLMTVGAHRAKGVLLLGDRFTSSTEEEDRFLQFQVWAIKSYTKTVPLYVQVLQRSSVDRISHFLDQERDQIVSLEQTRHRLLALSCLCPGASTLLGNLLRTANVNPAAARRSTLAGRRWFRAYVNGCSFKLFEVRVGTGLAGRELLTAAECLYRTTGLLLIGILGTDKRVQLNPGRRHLSTGDVVVVIANSRAEAQRALRDARFYPPPADFMNDIAADEVRYKVFNRGEGDYFNEPDGAMTSSDGEGPCTMQPFIGDLETESMDGDDEGVCGVDDEWERELRQAAAVAAQQKQQQQQQNNGGIGGPSTAATGLSAAAAAATDASSAEARAGPRAGAWAERYLEQQDREAEEDGDRASPAAGAEGSGGGSTSGGQPTRSSAAWAAAKDGQAAAAAASAAATASAADALGASQAGSSSGLTSATSGGRSSSRASDGSGGAASASDWNYGWGAIATTPSRAGGAIGNSTRAAPSSVGPSSSSTSSGSKGRFERPPLLPPPPPAAKKQRRAQATRGTELDRGSASSLHSDLDDDDDHDEAHPESAELQRAQVEDLVGHVIICGSEQSFAAFAEQLRASCASELPVVVLHPFRPPAAMRAIKALGLPVYYVQGNPSQTSCLRKANAQSARALVFLTHPSRPDMTVPPGTVVDSSRGGGRGRAAVLADADALMTCYGVGEDAGMERLHSVVELTFTTSVRFLQPGLLLKGVLHDTDPEGEMTGPRKGWRMRKSREAAAVTEGLAEWQANPYYCAGRVTVPALMDTFACQSFFNRGMLVSFLEDLCGDDGRPGGAVLRQIQLPPDMAGRRYGELVTRLTLGRGLIPIGLFRRKSENPSWRLHHVVTNPPAHEVLEATDRVFVLRERGGVWSSHDTLDDEDFPDDVGNVGQSGEDE